MGKNMRPFNFLGFRIEYSRFQKRWFVCDWDYEIGYYYVGPSHPSKASAMDWAAGRGI